MNKGTILLLVAVAVIAGFIGVYYVSMQSESTSYSDFVSAKSSGEEVHIVGNWIRREESYYDPNNDLFHFWMQDTTHNIAQVIYNNPKPNDFETAERVVIQGKYHEDIFYANSILMKCPSKYNEDGSEFTAEARKVESLHF